jgi:hypothetical protein
MVSACSTRRIEQSESLKGSYTVCELPAVIFKLLSLIFSIGTTNVPLYQLLSHLQSEYISYNEHISNNYVSFSTKNLRGYYYL